MAKHPKREAVSRGEGRTDAPQEKSLVLPLLIWSLCFVAFINVIIGAYLYTSYQNAQRRAEEARLQAQSAPAQTYTPPTADQIWGTQPPVRSEEPTPDENEQAPKESTAQDVQQTPEQPAVGQETSGTAQPVATEPATSATQPAANTGTPGQAVTPPIQQATTTQNNVSANNSASYSRENWPQGKLLGTVKSNKYHSYNCQGAQRIPKENEIWFDSVEDAKAAKYEPCGICYR